MLPDRAVADDLCRFIDASPSPYHAVESAAAELAAADFLEVDEADEWDDGPGGRFFRRGGSLVAWVATGAVPERFRIVGAHTDSPNLRIKPQPDRVSARFRQLGVEVYGGALRNSWLDRDLGLSGRVSVRGADAPREVLFRVDEPLLRVPQLAIHLDREINDKGLQLNAQQHLVPVWDVEDGSSAEGFVSFLADRAGCATGDVLAWDAMLHDLTPSRRTGRDGVFVSAPRLDNLCSSYAGIRALVAAAGADSPLPSVPVVCLYDHEEVGSMSSTGADGVVLVHALERVALAGGAAREQLLRALAGSACLSADMAHATHPNYAERHEPEHHVTMNAGVVVKVNANQRYASDATSAGLFLQACAEADVPTQRYAHRTDLPCGSTIGPITAARLGIPTVDVGIGQLAMHSAREMCGADDPSWYVAACEAFLRS